MFRKAINAIKKPERILLYCSRRGWLSWMSDKSYLKKVYRLKIGKPLNLDNPQTFNEKLQWLKLYNRDPKYTNLVDKYEVRNYIANTIGEEYLIPLLGVWDKFDDINFDELPQQFVLKCTHDSGSVIVCKDKRQFDVKKAKKKLSYCMKNNGYNFGREWPYKNIKPRIIAEKYMEDEGSAELKDYKILCFNGEPKLIQIHSGRFDAHTQDFYDCNWNKLDIRQGSPMSNTVMEKPSCIDEMCALTQKLSNIAPHVRIDWYFVNNRVYFGEITFFDGSGFDKFEPQEWDDKLGSWITLPINNKKESES